MTNKPWKLISRYPTPLRYPGGKHRLAGFFSRLIELNGLRGCSYVEPFAGSGGVGLSLLSKGLVKSVHLNDLDRSIYAFWHAIKHENDALCELIRSTPISMEEWDRQREIQQRKETVPILDLALSTLFLNRANRSGIIRGGMIGGRSQKGKWNIRSRFDRESIVARLQALKPLSDRIHVSNHDVLTSSDLALGESVNTLTYLDPPYFDKSSRLYMNHLVLEDHIALADKLRSSTTSNFVVTYDTAGQLLDLYSGFKRRFFELSHTAAQFREGREVMFFSQGLRVPRKIP